jgi:small multidrug resistance family-3 protein
MRDFIEKAMNATRKYTVLDFAVLKLCLMSIGVLLGLNYRKLFKRHIHVVWGVAIVSYLWTMGRLVCNIKKEYE